MKERRVEKLRRGSRLLFRQAETLARDIGPFQADSAKEGNMPTPGRRVFAYPLGQGGTRARADGQEVQEGVRRRVHSDPDQKR